MEDFELEEQVCVGTQKGKIVSKGYLVLLIDDDGLPFEKWFDAYMLSRGTVQ